MGVKDLFITPLYILILTGLAYAIRPYVTTEVTRRYFLPALWIKFLGAIAVGLIYQFYYGDGDTFTYFHRGSQYIWEAFLADPVLGLKMIFGEMNYEGAVFQYASQIYTYGDSASYAVVRVAGFFDLLTFHTYSATAVLFATLSFTGIWMIFLVFVQKFPNHTRGLAFSILFVPSIFFWGSGLLKDTLTMAALGWLLLGITELYQRRISLFFAGLLAIIGFYTLFTIKIYILICFLPALTFWLFLKYQSNIKNQILKYATAPALIVGGVFAAYFAALSVGQDHYRYSLDEVFYTAEQTAKWNYYVSERSGGSGYTLGDYDFSVGGLIRKFFPAVGTSFFRPFLFEVRNPVMLLAAIENSVILIFFIYSIYRVRQWGLVFKEPLLVLCFVFAVLFGFAIGATTYNFGSLVRYKIPMLPFLLAGLYLVTRRKVFT